MTALLEARGVRVRLGDADILHGADLAVAAGEPVAIVGPNGAGKSPPARAGSGPQPLHAGAVGLAQDAPVLIADEPTSHLDLGATAAVARLLRSLADDGLSVILVVHDLALAAAVADTVMVMAKGRSAATGAPRDVLTPDRLS